MVAHLIRLKLVLLRNGLRRSVGQLVGLIVASLYGLGILLLAVTGLIVLRAVDSQIAETIVVLGGSALLVGWGLTPILLSGVDLTLDPARFAPFPIPLPRLLAGQAIAGLIGVPGVCTTIALAATLVTWSRGPGVFAVAVLGALLALGLCVVVSRLVASALTDLASSRRFREASRIVVMVPLVLLGPIIALAARGIEMNAAALRSLAGVLSWTPLGAAFSAPAAAAEGDALGALVKLVIAAASLSLAAWGWSRALARALVTPASRASSGGRATARRGIGAFGWMPATPWGAIAARSLTYWIRDPRYAAALIIVPLLPVILYFSSVQRHNSEMFLLSGPLAAFLLAWSLASDISYDSTAFALHLAAGVRGSDDRRGRALALLTFAAPTAAVITLVPFLASGRWALLPAYLGLVFGVLLSGVGLASVVSSRFVVAVPLPGESPFKRPPGNTAQTILVQLGGLVALGILVLPEIVLVALASSTDAGFGWAALLVGLVVGGTLALLGMWLGGKLLDRRGPEVYAALTKAG